MHAMSFAKYIKQIMVDATDRYDLDESGVTASCSNKSFWAS